MFGRCSAEDYDQESLYLIIYESRKEVRRMCEVSNEKNSNYKLLNSRCILEFRRNAQKCLHWFTKCTYTEIY